MTGLLRRVTADYGGRDRREGGDEVLGILQQPGLEPLMWRRNSSLLHGLRRKWLPFESERNAASLWNVPCISLNSPVKKSTSRVLFFAKGAVRGAAAARRHTHTKKKQPLSYHQRVASLRSCWTWSSGMQPLNEPQRGGNLWLHVFPRKQTLCGVFFYYYY